MLKIIFAGLVSFQMLFSGASNIFLPGNSTQKRGVNGTLEKLIVADGSITIDLDISKLGGKSRTGSQLVSLRFATKENSFFTSTAFNGEFRGVNPSSMEILPENSASLPSKLNDAYQRLALTRNQWGSHFEFSIADTRSGYVFFNVEAAEIEYDANFRTLGSSGGRLILSDEFAAELGLSDRAEKIVGVFSFNVKLTPIEVTEIADGQTVSSSLPPTTSPEAGTVPGPDVVVGDLVGLYQPSGTVNGSQVGLAVGTDSCNFGTVNLNWLANPNNDHPVIPQNLYRMSGGVNNDDRIEQIGQSSVKHAFTALTENICSLGCNGVGGSALGSGCSDPYSASLNDGPDLGSRAWINPFTGAFPRNDSATPNNNHSGHSHVQQSHRILTNISDLSTTSNPGASYYAEAQYITPHEYAHCQANPGQCNMYNNVSYRKYNVSGTGSPFTFSPAAATTRMKPAIAAWTGSTQVDFNAATGTDGIGTVAYKVTNPSPGIWHYEYAVYNQNIDRAIQSFSIPLGAGITISNIGFHAPPQHPGWTADGTVGNAGFSNTPWTQSLTANAMTWSSETFAQNQNANAIRWGTMYNFRFDSNRPPTSMNATIGFLKTGSPVNVPIQGPSAVPGASAVVSGRVTSQNGRGISGARVTISATGVNRIATTNSFGYYTFENIPTGAMYSIAASAKRYNFTPQNMMISDNISGLNFTALP